MTPTRLRGQTGKVCGRPNAFEFHGPDEARAAVAPKRYRKLVVCLTLFDEHGRPRRRSAIRDRHRLAEVGWKGGYPVVNRP